MLADNPPQSTLQVASITDPIDIREMMEGDAEKIKKYREMTPKQLGQKGTALRKRLKEAKDETKATEIFEELLYHKHWQLIKSGKLKETDKANQDELEKLVEADMERARKRSQQTSAKKKQFEPSLSDSDSSESEKEEKEGKEEESSEEEEEEMTWEKGMKQLGERIRSKGIPSDQISQIEMDNAIRESHTFEEKGIDLEWAERLYFFEEELKTRVPEENENRLWDMYAEAKWDWKWVLHQIEVMKEKGVWQSLQSRR